LRQASIAADETAKTYTSLCDELAEVAGDLLEVASKIDHPGNAVLDNGVWKVELTNVELDNVREAMELAKRLVVIEQMAESYSDSPYRPAIRRPDSNATANLYMILTRLFPSKQDREPPGLRPVS
jgi:hypothetical protein